MNLREYLLENRNNGYVNDLQKFLLEDVDDNLDISKSADNIRHVANMVDIGSNVPIIGRLFSYQSDKINDLADRVEKLVHSLERENINVKNITPADVDKINELGGAKLDDFNDYREYISYLENSIRELKHKDPDLFDKVVMFWKQFLNQSEQFDGQEKIKFMSGAALFVLGFIFLIKNKKVQTESVKLYKVKTYMTESGIVNNIFNVLTATYNKVVSTISNNKENATGMGFMLMGIALMYNAYQSSFEG